jgi:hypothetical protein
MSTFWYKTYTVTEGSSARIGVAFEDADGVPAIPNAVSYKVVSEDETVLVASTSVTPASSVEIIVPGTVNLMVNEALPREVRRLVVTSTYGINETRVDVFTYYVENVPGV